jgi:hypothetical protein
VLEAVRWTSWSKLRQLVYSTIGVTVPKHGISVATYTVEVRRFRQNEAEFLKFEPGEKGASAHAAVKKIFKDLSKACHVNETDSLLLNVSKLESDDTDIWGLVKRGEYGTEIPIYSAETREQTYLQTREEGGLQPYYFRFHLPPGAKKGLLVLQRTGILGAYGAVRAAVEQAFKEAHQD